MGGLKSAGKATTALLAAFPNQASVQAFIKDSKDRNDIDRFIDFAERQGVIGSADFSTFRQFIDQNSPAPGPDPETRGMDLSSLLDSGSLLGAAGVNSVRNLVATINGLVTKFSLGEGMKVSATMLSRLRSEAAGTPKKRATLRSLAFWIGYSRPELAARWHYSTLLAVCERKRRALHKARHGARVGFFLHSQGDVIDATITHWLENEISDCLDLFAANDDTSNVGSLHHHDLTTFYVDLPLQSDRGEVDHPALFHPAARDAVALTLQILLRWTLSPWKTPKRQLTLGIVTGAFDQLTPILKPLLTASIAGDPAIRVSDAGRIALLINDIRVQFAAMPVEVNSYSGEALKIWSLTGVLSPLSWEFIPAMLEDPSLRAGVNGNRLPENRLYFPNLPHPVPSRGAHPLSPCLTTFFNSPQDSFLALELAKVLFYRHHLWDADEILGLLLSTDPCHVGARIFRMTIFWNLGLQEKEYSTALRLYQRAEAEAEFVRRHCAGPHADSYCEQALGKVAHGLHIFRLIRQDSEDEPCMPGGSPDHERGIPVREMVFLLLREALGLLQQGMTISPGGHRSFYHHLCLRGFIAMLERNPNFFNRGCPLEDHDGVCLRVMQTEFAAFGWLREDRDLDFSQRYLVAATRLDNASVWLRTLKPTTMLALATLTWDFSPGLTVGIVRSVLGLLQEAETMARELGKEGLCLYTNTRLHAEVMASELFIHHLAILQGKIMTVVGSDLAEGEEEKLINGGSPVALKLFCATICGEGD